MYNNKPLRYRISDWRQLTKCESNTSRDIHVTVTDFIQDDRLSGLRIQVNHNTFGTLFACVLNAKGAIVNNSDTEVPQEFTPAQILKELDKYGISVSLAPRNFLTGSMLTYLMLVRDLKYDKLRVLAIWHMENTNLVSEEKIVAFQANEHPAWLNNGYSASKAEFEAALNDGTAINLTYIGNAANLSWGWLRGFVASIDDVIADNSEVSTCPTT